MSLQDYAVRINQELSEHMDFYKSVQERLDKLHVYLNSNTIMIDDRTLEQLEEQYAMMEELQQQNYRLMTHLSMRLNQSFN